MSVGAASQFNGSHHNRSELLDTVSYGNAKLSRGQMR